jgi:hypothetical protein
MKRITFTTAVTTIAIQAASSSTCAGLRMFVLPYASAGVGLPRSYPSPELFALMQDYPCCPQRARAGDICLIEGIRRPSPDPGPLRHSIDFEGLFCCAMASPSAKRGRKQRGRDPAGPRPLCPLTPRALFSPNRASPKDRAPDARHAGAHSDGVTQRRGMRESRGTPSLTYNRYYVR